MASYPDDSLATHILRERETFLATHAHLPEAQRQLLWNERAAHLRSLLGTPAITTLTDSSPCTLADGSQSMNWSSSDHFPTGGVSRSRDYSGQSAPAAFSMSRTTSQTSEHNPFSNNGTTVPPLRHASNSSAVANWDTNEETFNPHAIRRTGSLRRPGPSRQTLPQVAESDVDVDVYNPADYVARISESLPNHPTFSITPSSSSMGYSQWELHDPRRPSFSSDHARLQISPVQSASSTQSPSTPQSTALTYATTMASDMSRQQSTASSFCGGFEMLNVNSSHSVFPFNLEDNSAVEDPQSFVADVDNKATFTDLDHSHFLRCAGGIGEEPSFSQSLPSSIPALVPSFPSSELVSEDMSRSLSHESNQSASSEHSSRSERRRKEQLANATRPIAPKQEATSMSRQSSEHKLYRIPSTDGSSQDKLVAEIPKASYVRPARPKVWCKRCDCHPEGFRGEHELRRHYDREHKTVRKMWICVDISPNKSFLANCKACRSGKQYGVYYNAAAHLRRTHFHPSPRGRGGRAKGRMKLGSEGRGGKGGGEDPPMDELKKWMREVEVLVRDKKDENISAIAADGRDNFAAESSGNEPVDEELDDSPTPVTAGNNAPDSISMSEGHCTESTIDQQYTLDMNDTPMNFGNDQAALGSFDSTSFPDLVNIDMMDGQIPLINPQFSSSFLPFANNYPYSYGFDDAQQHPSLGAAGLEDLLALYPNYSADVPLS